MIIKLQVVATDEVIELNATSLVLAGFSGRSAQAVADHVWELSLIGVGAPASVPTFWSIEPDLLRPCANIVAPPERTSGEIEYVLVRSAGRWFVGVGSDHHDKVIERESFEESKRAQPKLIGPSVIPLEEAMASWDDIELRCLAKNGDGQWVTFQGGRLIELITPDDLLEGARRRWPDAVDVDGSVIFSGTIPLVNPEQWVGHAYPMAYRLLLVAPSGVRLEGEYSITGASVDQGLHRRARQPSTTETHRDGK